MSVEDQQTVVRLEHKKSWMTEKIKAYQIKTLNGELKTANAICGVVDYPLWDMIEVSNYLFPVLHAAKIGLTNDCLDCFLDFVDD